MGNKILYCLAESVNCFPAESSFQWITVPGIPFAQGTFVVVNQMPMVMTDLKYTKTQHQAHEANNKTNLIDTCI